MKKKLLFPSLFLSGSLFIGVRLVHAASLRQNFCFPVEVAGRCWGAIQVAENAALRFLSGIAIWAMRGLASLIWLLDRIAAYVFSKSVTDNAWLFRIRSEMLNVFREIMPAVLQDTAFGRNGLMYVALSLAGLLMMVPLWGMGARFVRAEKVIVWGALLTVLFVGGSFGYDFIGMLEDFRQGLVEQIVRGGGGGALPLDRLLLQPMRAGSGDLSFEEALTLPPVFESEYFPAPELVEVTVSSGSGIGFGLGNANVELPEDIQARHLLAGWGIFYAAISLLGAWLLVVVGLAYLILSFAALVLILFLFAALPLGFFEFGGLLLRDLLQRYLQVIMQSLALAVFMRWLSSGLGFLVEVNTPTNALLWGVIVVIMSIIAGTFLNGSIKLMLTSGQSFQQIGAAFGGPSFVHRAGSAAGTAATVIAAGAALTGNIPAAIGASQVAGLLGGRQPASPADQQPPGENPQYGNVFVDNGAGEVER